MKPKKGANHDEAEATEAHPRPDPDGEQEQGQASSEVGGTPHEIHQEPCDASETSSRTDFVQGSKKAEPNPS